MENFDAEKIAQVAYHRDREPRHIQQRIVAAIENNSYTIYFVVWMNINQAYEVMHILKKLYDK